MSNSLVYAFDHEHPEPPMALKDLLGGKGANLAEMTSRSGCRCRPGSPSRPMPAGRSYGRDGRRA